MTEPPDLKITIHRENGLWWAEINRRPDYAASDTTFDGLCERLAEGLHLLGLNRERTAVFVSGDFISGGQNTASNAPRQLIFTGDEDTSL